MEWEPRSSGVGFFCFHALEDTKQKKPYPTRPRSPTPCKQGLKISRLSAFSLWLCALGQRTRGINHITPRFRPITLTNCLFPFFCDDAYLQKDSISQFSSKTCWSVIQTENGLICMWHSFTVRMQATNYTVKPLCATTGAHEIRSKNEVVVLTSLVKKMTKGRKTGHNNG